MKQHQGVWLPDGEVHLCDWMTKSGEIVDGKGTYQVRKLRAALEHVRDWRRAVDVGAHVGLWSLQIAKRFERLDAFEPIPQFRDCWLMNMKGSDACGLALHHCAIGAEQGVVEMSVDPTDTGGTHVTKFRNANIANVQLETIDSFKWDDVDFMKIDCEGYELQVVKGAVETLMRCRPCVIVEQKNHTRGGREHIGKGVSPTPAVDLLLDLGAKKRAVISGDHVLNWDT